MQFVLCSILLIVFWATGIALAYRSTGNSAYTFVSSGLCAWSAIVFVGVPLFTIKYLFLILTIPALALLALRCKHTDCMVSFTWDYAVLIILSIPFVYTIVYTPIASWDGRSIWYFAGKLIFYGNGITTQAGFSEPAIAWAHFDYPKLIPWLAAASASFPGYWNEYIPKTSQLILYILMILGIMGLPHPKPLTKIFIFIVFLMLRPEFIDNGYMDGWLAIFSALLQLQIMNYLLHRNSAQLRDVLITAGILPLVKTEGMILSLLSVTALLLYVFAKGANALRALGKDISSNIIILILSITPSTIWLLRKNLLGLHNWMTRTDTPLLHRFIDRCNFTDIELIINTIFCQQFAVVCFISLVLLSLIFFMQNPAQTSCRTFIAIPLFSILNYLVFIIVVFLITPFDLAWHLSTSADRVILPPVAMTLAVVTMILFDTFERRIIHEQA